MSHRSLITVLSLFKRKDLKTLTLDDAEYPVDDAKYPVDDAEYPVDDAEYPVDDAEYPPDKSEPTLTPSLEEKSEANAKFRSFLAALAISLGAAIILAINACVWAVCSVAQCFTKQVQF
jgi:hypothetical protein